MSRRDIGEQNDDALLAAYRAAACAEADAHFDERALETQRHRILARLANLGHPARVLRFPKAPAGDLPAAVGINRRWISVAAAAGLLIGLLGGQLVHLLPQPTRRAAPIASAPIAPARSAFVPTSASLDDSLLTEIDLAVQQRTPIALRALAELTLDDEQ
jgi:hypothetical protein